MSLTRITRLAALVVISACSTPKPAVPSLKAEGDVCSKDDECKTGLCEGVAGTQTLCTRKCADGCAASEICEQLTPGRFSCVKDRGQLCTVCQVDRDCPYPADKCITVDGKGVCGRDCAFNQACPTSYQCLQGLGTDGKPKSQQCTPKSGSCSCTATNAGQMVSCGQMNSSGTCNGFRTCDGVNGFTACSAKLPEPELCNGIDDDCDGQIDEGSTPVTCGQGACKVTISSCTAGGPTICTPLPQGTETCNAIDDDCNGVIDDVPSLSSDKLNCGRCGNACALSNASEKCVASACEIDACETGYGDCNGRAADGCEVELSRNAENCGMCNHKCSAPGSTASCVNGACQYQCAPGRIDLNGDPADGCEYACTPVKLPDGSQASDTPDVDFIDADCDGFDGEPANGIFVSDQTGDDTYAGTMASPVATIQRGVALAVQQNKRDVYVTRALSSYAGPLDLSNVRGKYIAGGYAVSAPRWKRAADNSTTVSGGNPSLVMNASHGTVVQMISFTGGDAVGAGATAYGAWVVKTADAGFQKLTFQAGRGAAGLPGSAGSAADPSSAPANGGAGGQNAEDDSSSFCAGHAGQPALGQSGVSLCGRTGGLGGVPGWEAHPQTSGANGGIGVVSTPGGDGQPRKNGAMASAGARGRDGTAGSQGLYAAKSASNLGAASISGYLPPVAGVTASGNPGEAGGGGGGGGGGCRLKDISGFDICCEMFGSAGGGGGAGGCGGGGASSGGGGGASVGLFMWASSAQANALTVRGGFAGNGGNGGSGGAGSTGGLGGISQYQSNPRINSGIGGAGGNGGAGGSGGHGAGGAGGPAIGYLHDASSRINWSQVIPRNGTRGSGGTGGGGQGSANDGAQGELLEELVR